MTDATEELYEQDADNAGDAAQAFDELRQSIEKLSREIGGEMTVIRKGVEAAFDQFDRIGKPVDYSADLGRMVENLAQVGERLQAIEKLPMLRLQPNQITRAAELGGEGLAKSLAREVEEAKRDLAREARNLANYTKSARSRERQDRNLWLAGLGGLVAGIAAAIVLLFFLPIGLDSRVAAAIMHRDRWDAGFAIMRAENPSGANFMSRASSLVQTNSEVIEKCRLAAAKAGQGQKCTIIVPVSGT